MSILQGSGDLLDIEDNCLQWQTRSVGVTVAQGPMRSILYYQKRGAVLHRHIQHAHNVRMGEICQGLCFLHKVGGVLFAELCVKDFEGSTAFEVDMLAQVDLGKASLAKKSSQAVITQLLAFTPSTFGHTSTSLGKIHTPARLLIVHKALYTLSEICWSCSDMINPSTMEISLAYAARASAMLFRRSTSSWSSDSSCTSSPATERSPSLPKASAMLLRTNVSCRSSDSSCTSALAATDRSPSLPSAMAMALRTNTSCCSSDSSC